MRFNIDNNYVFVYNLKIDSNEFGRLRANKNETIEEQKAQGRRPHVRLIELFVKRLNLKPDVIFDIRKCTKYFPNGNIYNRIYEELEHSNANQ